jgi:hypothetical protein
MHEGIVNNRSHNAQRYHHKVLAVGLSLYIYREAYADLQGGGGWLGVSAMTSFGDGGAGLWGESE